MDRRVIQKGSVALGVAGIVEGLIFLVLDLYAILETPGLVIGLIVPITIFVLSFMIINRLGGYVIIDKEKQTILRKGRFWGFKYSVKFEDIENVVFARAVKPCIYYVVVVDKAHRDSAISRDGTIVVDKKKSCIALESTEENIEFIKQIWDAPILEYTYTNFGDDNAFHR
jgi:hypothetical protein